MRKAAFLHIGNDFPEDQLEPALPTVSARALGREYRLPPVHFLWLA